METQHRNREAALDSRIQEPSQAAAPPGAAGAHESGDGPSGVSKRLRELNLDLLHVVEALDQHAIVSITDTDGDIVFANDEFCTVSGYAREELLGQNHRIVNSGHHSDEFFQHMWQTIAAGECWKGVLCNRTKSGAAFWVQTTISPVLDESGKPTYYIAVRTEVTRPKESEASRDRNAALLSMLNKQARELLEASPDLLQPLMNNIVGEWSRTLDADHALLVSAEAETDRLRVAFQFPEPSEALRHDAERRAASDNASDEIGREGPVMHRLQSAQHQHTLLGALARHGFELAVLAPFKGYRHRPYAVVFLWRNLDLADGVNAQLHLIRALCDLLASSAQRLRTEAALTAQTRRLDARQYLAQLGDWDMEVETLQIRWTPELFGFNAALASISLGDFVDLVHPDDRRLLLKELNRSINQHVPSSFEFRLQGDKREPAWVLMRGARMRDRFQQSDSVIATLIDVSEHKKTEAALKDAMHQAKLANETKSQFLSNMSHELRTPLNSILGFGQLLQLDSDLTEDQRENATEIVRSGSHLLNLINEVLDLSVIESGKSNLVLTRTDVASVVDESLAMVRQLAERRRIRLLREDMPATRIFVDRTKLKQAVINLLSNAIKYNRLEGSVTVGAEIILGDRLFLHVTDTGIGIEPDRQNDLFTPFARLGQERTNTEGTGIGLALTRSVVELMGGEVGLKSTLGTGSTFSLSFFLPETLERPPRSDAEKAPGEGTANSGAGREDSILLIERGGVGKSMLADALGVSRSHQLRAVDPDYDLERLRDRIATRVVLLYVGAGEDPELYRDRLRQARDLFDDPSVIALVRRDELIALEQALASCLDQICLLPIEPSMLLETIRNADQPLPHSFLAG